MKIRALKSFEGIRDNERNVFPKEGDIWEVSEERANFLKEHGVVEFVEEPKKVEIVIDNVANQPIGELQPEVKEAIEYLKNKKSNKKKKTSKK